MADHADEAVLARRLGERLRQTRLRKRRQQTVVAGLAGISTDYLYQLERGLKLPSLTVLMELARVLDLPLSALLDESTGPSPSGPVRPESRSDLGSGRRTAFVLDAIPAPSSVPFGDQLYTAMTAPTSQPPLTFDHEGEASPADLAGQVAKVWRLWQHSPLRYSQVGAVVPALVASMERQLREPAAASTVEQRRELAHAASDLYGLLRSFCKRVGRIELSLLSADRAVRLGEQADDPVRVAGAGWNLAHVLLADGQVDGADEVAMTAAELVRSRLDGPGADRQLDLTAMYGALLLVTAMASVRSGDAWEARTRIDEAARVARVTGERNTCWTAFGPTNVAMHAATVELVAGQAAEGLHLAERIDHRAAPSIERRIAFLLDQAHGWRQRRDNAQVLLLLLEAEREAPEDMRYRPLSRELVHHLVNHGRRGIAEQAAQLATRLGLPTER